MYVFLCVLLSLSQAVASDLFVREATQIEDFPFASHSCALNVCLDKAHDRQGTYACKVTVGDQDCDAMADFNDSCSCDLTLVLFSPKVPPLSILKQITLISLIRDKEVGKTIYDNFSDFDSACLQCQSTLGSCEMK